MRWLALLMVTLVGCAAAKDTSFHVGQTTELSGTFGVSQTIRDGSHGGVEHVEYFTLTLDKPIIFEGTDTGKAFKEEVREVVIMERVDFSCGGKKVCLKKPYLKTIAVLDGSQVKMTGTFDFASTSVTPQALFTFVTVNTCPPAGVLAQCEE